MNLLSVNNGQEFFFLMPVAVARPASTHQKPCFQTLETMLPDFGSLASTHWKQNHHLPDYKVT